MWLASQLALHGIVCFNQINIFFACRKKGRLSGRNLVWPFSMAHLRQFQTKLIKGYIKF
jgi:hypothetical protein